MKSCMVELYLASFKGVFVIPGTLQSQAIAVHSRKILYKSRN